MKVAAKKVAAKKVKKYYGDIALRFGSRKEDAEIGYSAYVVGKTGQIASLSGSAKSVHEAKEVVMDFLTGRGVDIDAIGIPD